MEERRFVRNILVILVVIIPSIVAVQLDRQGGYDIVIALQENTLPPTNPNIYLENIQKIFRDFSIHLYKATKQKFYIKSVELIIPESWRNIPNVDFGIDIATSQSYRSADVKVSSEIVAPRVDNPNACGTAGNFIELPLTFFSQPNYGNYGSPGKALLNLWARLRFGIWEEHGYPGNLQFPYVYQKPAVEPVWTATGCSEKQLSGKFVDRFKENCSMEDNGKPSDDCKFEPSPTNSASSSLLHFPWLHSVSEFCDLRTHNYDAPNRQNFLCGHRSAWDVIKETADYRKANGQSLEMLPIFRYNILTVSPKPLFYLLIDNGRSSYPVEIIREIMITVGNLYEEIDNVVSVGSFPNLNPRSNSYITEHIPWTSIGSTAKADFTSVLEELTSNEGAVVRDFGAAILEAVEKIKLKNHKAGAVIFVVKRGVGRNTFNRMAYEEEVTASLLEQTNIRLLAIELQGNEKIPNINLNNIVKETEGAHFAIRDRTNTARKLGPIMDTVKGLLKGPITSARKFRVITKVFTTPDGKGVEIPVLDGDYKSLKLQLTTSEFVKTSNVEVKLLSGDETEINIHERKEWNEMDDARKRVVHTFILDKPRKGSIWSIRYSCLSADKSDCTGFLVVYGTIDDLSKNSESEKLDVTVSTSSEDGFVDMSRQEPKLVPFAIYAKVERNGQPVLNLRNVQAIIRLSDNTKNWRIPLQDDGKGNPDVSSDDGVYSNLFVPLEDGFYRISVVVQSYNKDNDTENSVSGIGQLLPVHQYQIGCYNSTDIKCIPGRPTDSFSKVSDLPGRVTVENCATFLPGRPMKIMDFQVSVLPDFKVIFSFTSPKLIGSDESPQEFEIFMAPSANNYLGSTDLTKTIIRQIGSKPGTLEQIPYYTMQTALPYYAVEAINGNMRSGPSNIVGVNTGISSPTTTTEESSSISTTSVSRSTSNTEPTTTKNSISSTETPPSSTTTTSEASLSDKLVHLFLLPQFVLYWRWRLWQ